MLGREVVVIIGLGENARCGNGKIPSGTFGLWLLNSSILQVGLGVVVRGGLALWFKRGVWEMFVVLVWRKIQLHQRNGGSTEPEVGLWGIGLMVSIL